MHPAKINNTTIASTKVTALHIAGNGSTCAIVWIDMLHSVNSIYVLHSARNRQKPFA